MLCDLSSTPEGARVGRLRPRACGIDIIDFNDNIDDADNDKEQAAIFQPSNIITNGLRRRCFMTSKSNAVSPGPKARPPNQDLPSMAAQN